MNTEEAKFLLQGYRPDGRDAQDPQFAEALEQLNRDPALQEWFRNQQAFDGAIADKLRSVPLPERLKSSILTGRKTMRPKARWRRHPAMTTLAACLMVMLGLAAWRLSSPAPQEFSAFRADMVRFVNDLEQHRESLILETNDLEAIRSWVEEHSPIGNVDLPSHLTASSGLGCRVMNWHRHSVALICFRLEDDKPAHLLVIDRTGIRSGPAACDCTIASLDGMNTAAWATDTATYLLVSTAPKEVLQHLL